MPLRKFRNKYGAVKTVVDGITFDSKKEADWYIILRDKQKAGEIRDLALQVKFTLQPAFIRTVSTGLYNKKGEEKFKSISYRPIIYIADFTFYDNNHNRFRILDCKGMKTQGYILKKKMFAYKFLDDKAVIEESI